MAGRIRTIKPELLEDDVTAGLDSDSFRLFIGLLLLADDHGGLRCHPASIEGQIFWLTKPREGIARLIDVLAREDLILLYRRRNQTYLQIKNWTKHQRVDHPSKPRVPRPDDADVFVIASLSDDAGYDSRRSSREAREKLAPDPDLRPRSRPSSLAALEPSGQPALFEAPPERARSQEQGQGACSHVLASASTAATSTEGVLQDSLQLAEEVPATSTRGGKKSGATGKQRSEAGHQGFVDWFHSAFTARYGEPPTWDGPALRVVKDLLAEHGYDTCVRRATRMLNDPPAWLTRGGGSLGMRHLKAHFDQFIAVAAQQTAAQDFIALGAVPSPPPIEPWLDDWPDHRLEDGR